MTQETKSKPKRRCARTPIVIANAATVAAVGKSEATRPETKIGNIVALLKRKQGATLEQMVKATGWQPHTTRAAMTGLKKKGHAIEREQVDGVSHYRITAGA